MQTALPAGTFMMPLPDFNLAEQYDRRWFEPAVEAGFESATGAWLFPRLQMMTVGRSPRDSVQRWQNANGLSVDVWHHYVPQAQYDLETVPSHWQDDVYGITPNPWESVQARIGALETDWVRRRENWRRTYMFAAMLSGDIFPGGVNVFTLEEWKYLANYRTWAQISAMFGNTEPVARCYVFGQIGNEYDHLEAARHNWWRDILAGAAPFFAVFGTAIGILLPAVGSAMVSASRIMITANGAQAVIDLNSEWASHLIIPDVIANSWNHPGQRTEGTGVPGTVPGASGSNSSLLAVAGIGALAWMVFSDG